MADTLEPPKPGSDPKDDTPVQRWYRNTFPDKMVDPSDDPTTDPAWP